MIVVAVVLGLVLFVGGLLLILRAALRAYDRPPPPRLTAEDLMRRHEDRKRHDQ